MHSHTIITNEKSVHDDDHPADHHVEEDHLTNWWRRWQSVHTHTEHQHKDHQHDELHIDDLQHGKDYPPYHHVEEDHGGEDGRDVHPHFENLRLSQSVRNKS